MKKFLLVSAAALLVFTVAAEAKHHKHKPTRAEQAYDHGFSDGEHGAFQRECIPEVVTEIGGQRPTYSWARRLAREAWQRKVRFEFGEQFLELDNAADIHVACSHSSIGSVLKRCLVKARPCKAPEL